MNEEIKHMLEKIGAKFDNGRIFVPDEKLEDALKILDRLLPAEVKIKGIRAAVALPGYVEIQIDEVSVKYRKPTI